MRKHQQQRELSIDDGSTTGAGSDPTAKARIDFIDRIVERAPPAPGEEDTERLYADRAYDKNIRDRAYALYLTRHEGHGSAEGDWFEAEREFTSETQR